MSKKIIIIGVIVVILLVIAGIGWAVWHQDHQQLAKLQAFAQCITKSGAKFYGAFWCPHCQDQKGMFETTFGSAVSDLPYTECSTPDANGQLQVCKDAGITAYPTWKFADGTTQQGEMTLQQLAAKTNCSY